MTTCFAVYTPDNWPLVTWVPSNARATPAPPPPKKKEGYVNSSNAIYFTLHLN